MKHGIARRLAQTKVGYWIWSQAQGTAFSSYLSGASKTLRRVEMWAISRLPKNARYDRRQQQVLAEFEQETRERKL